jgi:hypothetical protein
MNTNVAERLRDHAKSIIMVMDREGDIYGAFANRPDNACPRA